MAEVVRRWAQTVQMRLLRADLEPDIDQIPEFGVEAASAVEFAVVAVAFADDSCDHWTVRTFVHFASQEHSAGIVAVVGKTAVPSEQADHCVPKIHSVVVQSQGAGNACCSAVRVGPSFEAIVETVAEAAGEPLAALWGGVGEVILVVL